MNTLVQKSRDEQKNITADRHSIERSSARSVHQLSDDNPASAAQRALEEKLNNSPKVQEQIQIKQSLNQSPQVQSLTQMQQMLNQSPRAVAQARLAARLSSPDSRPQPQQTTERLEEVEEEKLLGVEAQSASIQREVMFGQPPEEKEPFESKSDPIQNKDNNTGLPDNLRAGIESLSGMSMDDVKVHYNSPKPAQLQALAYTQGSDIHVAPGQEKHLPHEVWHVAQQRQGRVKPTLQLRNTAINDDSVLEQEADVMGKKAANSSIGQDLTVQKVSRVRLHNSMLVQRVFDDETLTELERAIKRGDLDKATGMIGGVIEKINTKNNEENTLLIIALEDAKSNKRELVQLLLDNGADPSIPNTKGWTPLQLAVVEQDESLVAMLLDRGVAVNTQNDKGTTPLGTATKMYQSGIVKLLLDNGADIGLAGENVPMLGMGLLYPNVKKQIQGRYPETLKQAFVKGLAEMLKMRLAAKVPVEAGQVPQTMEANLVKLAEHKYELLLGIVQGLVETPQAKQLAQKEVVEEQKSSKHQYELGETERIKFLAHLSSLKGNVSGSRLEGMHQSAALLQMAAGLQYALNSVEIELRPQIAKELNMVIKAFERQVEIDLLDRLFMGIGEGEQAAALIAQSIMQTELMPGEDLLLSTGYQGERKPTEKEPTPGHSIYLTGIATGKENILRIHNLGQFVESHPTVKSPKEKYLPYGLSFDPKEDEGALFDWLKNIVLVSITSDPQKARKVLYEGCGLQHQKYMKEVPPETQHPQKAQLVGNCAIKNLNAALLVSIEDMLGREQGLALFKIIKGHLRAFAEQAIENKQIVEQIKEVAASKPLEEAKRDMESAIMRGDENEVKRILGEHSGIVNERIGDQGRTPLTLAVFYKRKEMAYLLMEKGAVVPEDIMKDARVGMSLRVLICVDPDFEFIMALCNHGLKPGMTDRNGKTLLASVQQFFTGKEIGGQSQAIIELLEKMAASS